MTTKDELVIDQYFTLTETYRKEYIGKKIAIFMQVGSFFEIYGFEENNICDKSYSEIEDVSKICDFAIANKKRVDSTKRYVMSGFPDHMGVDKYVELLLKHNYIVPVYIQIKDKNGKVKQRICENIYSPGTYVNHSLTEQTRITNNIMCIWIQPYKNNVKSYIKFGGAVMNMYTSETHLFEYDKDFIFDSTTFDELDGYMRIYNPYEIIFITSLEEEKIQDIMRFCGVQHVHYHIFDFENSEVKNVEKQTYQKHIINQLHGTQAYDYCFEFRKVIALQSYCYLLNVLEKYNKNYIKNIKFPIFESKDNKVVLANHTLMQLNILSEKNEHGTESSILSLLNKTKTSMGKRLFKQQLCNPTFDTGWLQKEYDFIEFLKTDMTLLENVRKHLYHVIDLEKFIRRLINKNIMPCEIKKLYDTIKSIQEVNKFFTGNNKFYQYLCNNEWIQFENILINLINYFEEIFDIEKCGYVNTFKFVIDSFFKNGYSKKIDSLHTKLNKATQSIDKFTEQHFSGYNVKLEEKKDDIYLQITEKRSKDWKNINQNIDKSISFKKSTGSNMRIEGSHEEDCKTILQTKILISDQTKELYQNVLEKIENENIENIQLLADFVGKLDVIMNKAYVATKYNYCKPIIQENEKSFVDARELRHSLIEHIQKNELYVGNDMYLGKEKNGILLYGTNAVGKTSLIRAVGISIILAQSGMYVPSSEFTYCPYKSIYSRILNHDNLFRGLSTFAVEMSELRVILNDADENSLILGDELCSGTEMQSALGIFTAGLIHLHEKMSSFIFATHFHEIVDLDEVKSLDKICFQHLTVHYNYETGLLEYDRKLKDGSGERVYGLEVCKSLYMPNQFIEKAIEIRNKYYPETQGYLSYKPSKYNKNVLRGMCVRCNKKISEETHHKYQQKEADNAGFIGSFHKNHSANLEVLCEECHLKEHNK